MPSGTSLPLISFSILEILKSPIYQDQWPQRSLRCPRMLPIALEGQQAAILPRVPYKGVNFVPEAVSVWLVERNILTPVNTGVSFQDYRYFTNMSVKIMLVKVKI